jgi:hypothetical protein
VVPYLFPSNEKLNIDLKGSSWSYAVFRISRNESCILFEDVLLHKISGTTLNSASHSPIPEALLATIFVLSLVGN